MDDQNQTQQPPVGDQAPQQPGWTPPPPTPPGPTAPEPAVPPTGGADVPLTPEPQPEPPTPEPTPTPPVQGPQPGPQAPTGDQPGTDQPQA